MRALMGASNVVLFALMLLTFVDVVGRYIFNAPVTGAFEITEFGLAILIFAALPLVAARDEHVVVDVFDVLMRPGLLKAQKRLMNALACIGFGVVTWQLWIKAGKSVDDNQITTMLEMPLAPLIYLMALLTALSTLTFLVKAIFPDRLLHAGNWGETAQND